MGCSNTKETKKSLIPMQKIDLSREKINDDELILSIPVLKNCLPKETIDRAAHDVFLTFDKDQNGRLDKSELTSLLKFSFKEQKINVEVTDEYIDSFFKDYDKDRSSTLEEAEFAKYLAEFYKHLTHLMEEEAKRRKLKGF